MSSDQKARNILNLLQQTNWPHKDSQAYGENIQKYLDDEKERQKETWIYTKTNEPIRGLYFRNSRLPLREMVVLDENWDKFDRRIPRGYNRFFDTYCMSPIKSFEKFLLALRWITEGLDAVCEGDCPKIISVGFEYCNSQSEKDLHPNEFKLQRNKPIKMVIVRDLHSITLRLGPNCRYFGFTEETLKAMVVAFQDYVIVGTQASLMIWRISEMHLACDLVDVTALLLPCTFDAADLPSNAAAAIQQGVAECNAQCPGKFNSNNFKYKELAWFVAFDDDFKSRPSAYDQKLLVQCHQAWIIASFKYSDSHYDTAVVTTLGKVQGLREIRKGFHLVEETKSEAEINFQKAMVKLVRDEMALTLERDRVRELRVKKAGVVKYTMNNGPLDHVYKVAEIEVEADDLNQVPRQSKRQLIRCEVEWSNENTETNRDVKYSTMFARVLSSDRKQLKLWFPWDRLNYYDLLSLQDAPPLNSERSGAYCNIVRMRAIGPYDLTPAELHRYKFFYQVSLASPSTSSVPSYGKGDIVAQHQEHLKK